MHGRGGAAPGAHRRAGATAAGADHRRGLEPRGRRRWIPGPRSQGRHRRRHVPRRAGRGGARRRGGGRVGRARAPGGRAGMRRDRVPLRNSRHGGRDADPERRRVRPGDRGRPPVLGWRRRRWMVLAPADPNARSVGSFFVNPVLPTGAFDELVRRWRDAGEVDPIPTFPADGRVKVPAAWLIEHAGFAKGYRQGGVGISTRHALALVNHGGTTTELLALAQSIDRAVYERFGVRLEREPVGVG